MRESGRFSAVRDAQGRALCALEVAGDVNDVAFEFRVTGHEPRPWGTGESEWKWRGEVAAAICAAAEQAGRKLPFTVAGSEAPSIAVEVIFRMTPKHFNGADLDNLAKPMLGTLFLAKHVSAPESAGDVSGVLFRFDNSRVVRLVLEKRSVESVGGAGIDAVVRGR